MSIEYFVLCRAALPLRDGGWSLRVGPVSIVELDDDEEALLPPLRPLALTLNLSSSALGGEVAVELARLLALHGQGLVVDEEGVTVDDVHGQGAVAVSGADLEARLRDVWDSFRARASAAQRDAMDQFERALATDPQVKAANDWSDLD